VRMASPCRAVWVGCPRVDQSAEPLDNSVRTSSGGRALGKHAVPSGQSAVARAYSSDAFKGLGLLPVDAVL
jgi:hypothetical protein